MMISKHSIETLKQNLDIVEIIGAMIDLKKSGSNYVACCPFHNEKTPSFVVSPIKGFYHCYGCGVGGDAIKFVMEHDQLSFIESIEKIASMIGFTLEYEQSYVKKADSVILDELTRFYQKQLLSHKPSLDYLASRHISNASIEKFAVGYCGASFETLNFISASNFNKQEALDFGVIGKDGNREYARFSDRIIFPIYAPNGKVVGFGGRTMKESNAKYINSPQSKIFNKSKLLYGYYHAKERIYKQKKIIVCEGYLDVIMLHQAGFDYAVATLGTALTKEHLPLLRKGEPEVILSYDGDNAGINAAFKASKILSENRIEGGVVIFKNGADPADMVAQKKINELESLFSHPIPFIEFVFSHIAQQFDLKNPLQKEKAFIESSQFLNTLSPILQEEYKPFLARLLMLPVNLIGTKHGSVPTPQELFNQHTQDVSEAILIKTLLERRDMIDFVIEYIDSSLFVYYKNEFEILLAQQYESPELLAIALNTNIKTLSDLPSLKEHLRLLIMHTYSRLLTQIPYLNNLDMQHKRQIINQIKTRILKLKKGELLPYVGISTF